MEHESHPEIEKNKPCDPNLVVVAAAVGWEVAISRQKYHYIWVPSRLLLLVGVYKDEAPTSSFKCSGYLVYPMTYVWEPSGETC